jgi:hypothetical protein
MNGQSQAAPDPRWPSLRQSFETASIVLLRIHSANSAHFNIVKKAGPAKAATSLNLTSTIGQFQRADLSGGMNLV